jgi:hypothetical protein
LLARQKGRDYIVVASNPYPIMLLTLTLQVFVIVFIIALLWHIFEKAGQPGWACIVPGYNIYILLKITGVLKNKAH